LSVGVRGERFRVKNLGLAVQDLGLGVRVSVTASLDCVDDNLVRVEGLGL